MKLKVLLLIFGSNLPNLPFVIVDQPRMSKREAATVRRKSKSSLTSKC